ncbi:hypothetical protein [Seonamhaeicola marinus]|uniref:Uncharacterized protein n=1 Tax=Seonamhaeicola marinus TaxID=1912246 RepID=A0A5D0HS18_9FLAO|nr:hypothetical protein [Seonamhaeicola marinus]TYA74078.1 hypothetical protein FUA24_12075 [Seonamhaeicola marinus]
MKLLTKTYSLLILLIVLLLACESDDNGEQDITGIVQNTTSCGGAPEPVFIIKVSETDLIMTGTLPKEFQETNKKIRFKTKDPEVFVYCTHDKIYPQQFDVFDVVLIED